MLLKNFGLYAKWMSEVLKEHAQSVASEAGRPYLYLEQSYTRRRGCSKEELARQIAERDGVSDGLICVLAVVEPCSSFDLYRNRDSCRLELRRRRRQCLHFYYYFLDRELGFCHVRVQSWLPFEIQIWLNGVRTVDYTESEPGIAEEGLIAVQIHGGAKAVVFFKDIAIEELP